MEEQREGSSSSKKGEQNEEIESRMKEGENRKQNEGRTLEISSSFNKGIRSHQVPQASGARALGVTRGFESINSKLRLNQPSSKSIQHPVVPPSGVTLVESFKSIDYIYSLVI